MLGVFMLNVVVLSVIEWNVVVPFRLLSFQTNQNVAF
jgi:hypothetical protein